jgi:hypothetical protein
MIRVLTSVAVTLCLSAVAIAQSAPTTQPGTQKTTPAEEAKAKNLMEDVTRVGCLKAWQPGPAGTGRLPETPKTGTYVLTPISADPERANVDLPTYLLVGGATVNFAAHLNQKVEIAGIEQAAQLPPTVQEIASAPAITPENRVDARSMPTLTVKSLKMLSTVCS